jgi:arabinose-5-phosphate isomerase
VVPGASVTEALMEMTRKNLGMTAIADADDHLCGVFTDGDLRRALDDSSVDLRTTPVSALMTANPRTISEDKLAIEAARMMESHKISGLLVVNAEGLLVGALNFHDLLRARVI